MATIVGEDLGKGFKLKTIAMGANDDCFIVDLQMIDKMTTPIRAKFQIIYDNDKKRFRLEQLQVKLQSESIFSMGANLVVKLLNKTLDSKIEAAINEKFTELLQFALNPPGPVPIKDELKLQTFVREIEIYEVRPSQNYFHAIGVISGHLDLVLGE